MATEPPAYKQFWPWFLFGLPGIVVVAGLTTWYIAARYADHLVVDDYYKDGLAINEVLRKQQLAEKLAIRAELTVQGNLAQVHLTNSADAAALQLDLYHPMDAARDMSLPMSHQGEGHYQGQLPSTASHKWHWSLRPLGVPVDRQWQIDGEVTIIPGNDS